MNKILVLLVLLISHYSHAGYVEINDLGEKRSSYKEFEVQSTITTSKVPQYAVKELPTYILEDEKK
ncbi:TPA: hypothetical protein ACJEU7_001849 [Acinetobacter baumannii]|uniref:hypothetical protein n=1 Tax=Acinetobacter baumannii TaxID=470 RepID=UPI002258C4B4|nr:hypothetical protein [Acinetobacter baumannii]MCX3035189.1 hypothetical protein [Acinetobacter baumannii]